MKPTALSRRLFNDLAHLAHVRDRFTRSVAATLVPAMTPFMLRTHTDNYAHFQCQRPLSPRASRLRAGAASRALSLAKRRLRKRRSGRSVPTVPPATLHHHGPRRATPSATHFAHHARAIATAVPVATPAAERFNAAATSFKLGLHCPDFASHAQAQSVLPPIPAIPTTRWSNDASPAKAPPLEGLTPFTLIDCLPRIKHFAVGDISGRIENFGMNRHGQWLVEILIAGGSC